MRAVAEATGRLPVVYVHPTWANGDPLPVSGLSSAPGSRRIDPPRCGLWVADYHNFANSARLGRRRAGGSGNMPATRVRAARYNQTTIVQGVSHCDRNLFNGDATALSQFWGAAAGLDSRGRSGLIGINPFAGSMEKREERRCDQTRSSRCGVTASASPWVGCQYPTDSPPK